MTEAQKVDRVRLSGARYILQDTVLPRETIFDLILRKLCSGELEATSEWVAFSYKATKYDDGRGSPDLGEFSDPHETLSEEEIGKLLGLGPFLYRAESMPTRPFKTIGRSQGRVKLPPAIFKINESWDTNDWFIRDQLAHHLDKEASVDRTYLKQLGIPACDFVVFCKIELNRAEVTQIGRDELPEVTLKPMAKEARYTGLKGRRLETTWHQWWAALVVAAAHGQIKAESSKLEIRRSLNVVLDTLRLKDFCKSRDHEQLNLLIGYLEEYEERLY